MKEQSLFDFPQFKITKKIRLIELFGGIGSQAMALRDIGANFEHYRLVEFDKYAVASYNAIHNTQHTTHDIRQIHAKDLEITDKDKYCYLMTYSFPCTDLSVAGKMKGMSKEDWQNGNSTRSGLLWEVERILKECTKEELPDVLLMENVPQVHAEQNRADFDAWLNFLKSKGYKNFWKDLNGKDYGIPQNRVRCFCVSFLSDDDFMEFTFPEPVKLEKVMKDFLEESVDEKYYIKNEKAQKLIKDLITNGTLRTEQIVAHNRPHVNLKGVAYLNYRRIEQTDCKLAKTLCARDYKGFGSGWVTMNGVIEKMVIPLVVDKNDDNGNYVSSSEAKLFVNDEPIARTLTCKCGGGQEVHHNNMVCVAMRGRNPEHPTDRTPGIHTEQRLEMNKDGLVNTLTTVQKDNLCLEIKKVGQISNDGSQCGTVVSEEGLFPTISAGTHGYANAHIATHYRIRKLTPNECWRLMGYTDTDFDKANEVNSATQLYKQAGNAIVKQVLMAIFSQLNIKGVKAWNDMTETEKRDIIKWQVGIINSL